MTEPLLTVKQLAARIQVNPRTINTLAQRGMPHMRLGAGTRTSLRFSWPEVEAWLRAQQERSAS